MKNLRFLLKAESVGVLIAMPFGLYFGVVFGTLGGAWGEHLLGKAGVPIGLLLALFLVMGAFGLVGWFAGRLIGRLAGRAR